MSLSSWLKCPRVPRWNGTPRNLISLIAVVALINAFQISAASSPGKPVKLLCVDAKGAPVAGAEVYLFQHNEHLDAREKFLQSGPFTSDAEGKVVGPDELVMTKEGNFDRWIYARVPSKLVGVARSAQWTGRKPFNTQNKVTLYPSRSVSGEVTVPDGFDPTKVLVKARTFWVATGPNIFDHESFPREDNFPGLDTALPEIFDRRPDATGHIQFDDIPVSGRLGVMTVAEGLAEAQWSNYEKSFDDPIELKLVRESRLTGRVLLPDGKPAAGMHVSAWLLGTTRIPYLTRFKATTDENGAFTIRALPSLDISFRIVDPRQEWVFRPLDKLRVPPEETVQMEPKMERGVLIKGRLIDPSGKAVAGAGISAYTGTQPNLGLGDDGTDKDGRFQFRLPSGKAVIIFNSLPDGLEYPDPRIAKELELTPGQPDVDLEFTVKRKAQQ